MGFLHLVPATRYDFIFKQWPMNYFHISCVTSLTWFMQRRLHGLAASDPRRYVDLNSRVSSELPGER